MENIDNQPYDILMNMETTSISTSSSIHDEICSVSTSSSLSKEEENIFREYIIDLDDNEYEDLQEYVFDLIQNYIDCNILFIGSPLFYGKLINEVTQFIYDDFIELFLCEYEPTYEQVYEFISDMAELYYNIIEKNCPRQCYLSDDTTLIPFTPLHINTINEQLEIIKNTYQPIQKTKEWYEYRHNLMTASNIWKIFKSEKQKNSLIYEKCIPLKTSIESPSSISSILPTSIINMNKDNSDDENVDESSTKKIVTDVKQNENNYPTTIRSLQWGIIFEPLSIQIYEHMVKTTVKDFGCIKHPLYDCIGASPDGINIDPKSSRYGRMIEVKNIVNREITNIPKEEYWIQMQIQMETCNLDECDFIETRFKEYEDIMLFWEDGGQYEWKGVILSLMYEMKLHYVYMPIEIHDKKKIGVWMDTTIKSYETLGHTLNKVHYWYLDEFSCVLVKRNRLWFQSAVPMILDTWKTITYERIHGYEHRSVKKINKICPHLMNALNEGVENDKNIRIIKL